ncbi:MAG: hypothetical protein LBJ91_04475 [Clostridiales Family XIII bacterium]|jgi:hypothetical protein|nr:hypothetical protein [Clostridiales Family XIII bacterium]
MGTVVVIIILLMFILPPVLIGISNRKGNTTKARPYTPAPRPRSDVTYTHSAPTSKYSDNDKATTKIGSLSDAMAPFKQMLHANSIGYSIQGDKPNTMTYRNKRFMPFISIETTQLFTNPSCAMTYLNKQWRNNPFAKGNLGSIDISVAKPFEICASACLPGGIINDEDVRQEKLRQIKTLIPQGNGVMVNIQHGEFLFIPYIMISLGFDDPKLQTSDMVFNALQMFAIEVHRIFGSITIPSEESTSPPKSHVTYTPDATDANGGYFVYGLDGFVWWIVDKDFKFQSIVGEHVWKEHEDAEADGLPLTATDYDNLHYYENGNVYRKDGTLMGRYSADRI